MTLLGTGGPEFTPTRLGSATLIEAKGQKLLFDAGRGVAQRLYEARVNPANVTTLFLTHLHNDHIEGLPTLWMTPWFLLNRQSGLNVFGPVGTAGMIVGMREMFRHDVERRGNPRDPKKGLEIDVTEIAKEGVVYDRKGVRVTAFAVEHADGNPAFGYRVDSARHSVVLSGDTTFSENVVRYGKNADIIVHNVIAVRPSDERKWAPVLAKLTTPEQASAVFRRTRPRLAVYSHIVKKELSGRRGDAWIFRMTRRAGYRGRLKIGQDRMVIKVGNEVRVIPPRPTRHLPDLDQ